MLSLSVGSGDCLLIVPPFASLEKPSLGVHILQACAREAGLEVKVLYANFPLAAEIGELNYEALCYAPNGAMIGERFFASSAYGLPPLGSDGFADHPEMARLICESKNIFPKAELPELTSLEKKAASWADSISRAVVQGDFKAVGCTTTFEQTAASIALLNRIKILRPDIITIIGGANCMGEMADGIVSLGSSIDYIFSGDSEKIFPEFLKGLQKRDMPIRRIIRGEPCMDLEAIPLPDFSEFYDQLNYWIPKSTLLESGNLWLSYETSRGCWWGQKHQCTFCGLNGEMIRFREKSRDKVLNDLKELVRKYPARNICMTDNNMPRSYFKSLLPTLPEELSGINIFYELKANMSLDEVVALKKAGISVIQPGIESLSTRCLKLMNKGVNARQNIDLLRYSRAVGLSVSWNILYGFPDDRAVDYKRMIELMPLLYHLHPPMGISQLSIERFSRYFNDREKFGISNVRPIDAYAAVLPETAEVDKIAYHFTGKYESESLEQKDVVKDLNEGVKQWISLWQTEGKMPPALAVTEIGGGNYMLIDSRGLPGSQEISFITRDEASLILSGYNDDSKTDLSWALDRGLLAEVDSRYVPLATALPDLLIELRPVS